MEQPRISEICYRRLFETAKDGILIVSVDTRKITAANPFIAELLGYNRDELIGQELWEIGLLSDVSAAREAFRELMAKGYIRYENLPLQTKDKIRREVEFVSNVYLEGGHQVIQCNIRDITERMQEQRHLHQINSEMTTLIAELHRRDAEMSVLIRMHEMLQACATQEEAYKVIASIAGELFAGMSGCLATLDGSNGQLEKTAFWGNTASVEPIFSLEDCWALRRDQPYEVTGQQVGMLCHHFVKRPDTGYFCIPLTVNCATLGIMCFLGTDVWTREYRIGQVRLAVAVGEAIKMSLAKLKLQEKLREQAIHDPLTGLLNRRFLEETLTRDLYLAQRRNSQLSVIMLDLDNFKRFNDTFGHVAGDSILRELGRVIREILRKSDLMWRYGGDEFVLVLFDSPLKDSQKRMEQICATVRGMRSGDLYAKFGPITLSAGIAQRGANSSDSIELLHAADRALYAAKAAGGDRVAIYQENKSYKNVG